MKLRNAFLILLAILILTACGGTARSSPSAEDAAGPAPATETEENETLPAESEATKEPSEGSTKADDTASDTDLKSEEVPPEEGNEGEEDENATFIDYWLADKGVIAEISNGADIYKPASGSLDVGSPTIEHYRHGELIESFTVDMPTGDHGYFWSTTEPEYATCDYLFGRSIEQAMAILNYKTGESQLLADTSLHWWITYVFPQEDPSEAAQEDATNPPASEAAPSDGITGSAYGIDQAVEAYLRYQIADGTYCQVDLYKDHIEVEPFTGTPYGRSPLAAAAAAAARQPQAQN